MSFTINEADVSEAFDEAPEWSDIDRLRALALVPYSRGAGPPITIGRHPLLAPWRDQIIETAALEGALVFGDEVGPEFRGARAGGQHAYLSDPTAPTCGLCSAPLTLCFQLPADMLSPWLTIDGVLTACYCFECRPEANEHYDFKTRKTANGALACRITVEQPNNLVELAPNHEPARQLTATQRWGFPRLGSMEGGFDFGAFAAMVDWDINPQVDISDEYMALVASRDGYSSPHVQGSDETLLDGEVWRTNVGGYPNWDQDDVTPSCPTCDEAMQLVLDYNGHQFLDGALHVFTCTRTADCVDAQSFQFVAEF